MEDRIKLALTTQNWREFLQDRANMGHIANRLRKYLLEQLILCIAQEELDIDDINDPRQLNLFNQN